MPIHSPISWKISFSLNKITKCVDTILHKRQLIMSAECLHLTKNSEINDEQQNMYK